MKRIKVKNYGTIHHIAMCKECDWNDGIKIEETNRSQKLRNRVYKHIRQTGHRVQVEGGTSRDYYLEKEIQG